MGSASQDIYTDADFRPAHGPAEAGLQQDQLGIGGYSEPSIQEGIHRMMIQALAMIRTIVFEQEVS